MDESMIEKKRSRRDQTKTSCNEEKALGRFLERPFPVWSFRFRFVNRIDNHFQLTGDFESATDSVVLLECRLFIFELLFGHVRIEHYSSTSN